MLLSFTIADDECYKRGQSRTVSVNPLDVSSVEEKGGHRSVVHMRNGDKFFVCDFGNIAQTICDAQMKIEENEPAPG